MEHEELVVKLSKKMGRDKVGPFLSNMAKKKQFLDAISTNVGQELMKDAMNQVEDLTIRLIEKDDDEVRAKIKAYDHIVNKWSKTINKYQKELQIIHNL